MYLYYRFFFLFMPSLAQKSAYKPKNIYKHSICIHKYSMSMYVCMYTYAPMCVYTGISMYA